MSDVLASAGYVDVELVDTAEQSEWPMGLLLTDLVTTRRRKRWTLRWDGAQPGVIAALERHYAANRVGPFDFTPPGGTATKVIYTDQAPSLAWTNTAGASASVVLEECLATD